MTPEGLDHLAARWELLRRLRLLNAALTRQGADPLVTSGEAMALPHDHLAAMVALSADRLVTVSRALAGVP